jgi:alpha,alpha-trehalase
MRVFHPLLVLLLLVSIGYGSACRQAPDAAAIRPDTVSEDLLAPPNERWGDLFTAVQLAGIFPDSKTFVDCIPKQPAAAILTAYAEAKDQPGFELRSFVLEHFELPPEPATNFTSDSTRSIREHINALWPVLTRQPDAETTGSLIPLPHPYIVPGGRFREIYYWDSYFTMLGLQAAGRTDMIQNMVDNFAYLIDTIGFIPNGNRTYYLTRSQPPFFAGMVGILAQATNNDSVFVRYLPQLQREYDWWMEGGADLTAEAPAVLHTVRLPDGSVLNRYYDRGDYPRAESYREDVETAEASDRDAATVYRHLRSGAESGWDFTSRWFADGQTLATIQTTDIVPPDLNALLFHLERTLATGYLLAGDSAQAARMTEAATGRAAALRKYCWDAETGAYQDYEFPTGTLTGRLSLATVYPLYFGMASPEEAAAVAELIEARFLRPGGVLTTLVASGEQWDAPNGWPPLQWMTIQGLRRYGHTDLADRIATGWQDLNERVYRNVYKMVEKYNVVDMSLLAGGGEYPVQDGFGWSNGVYLGLAAEVPVPALAD